MKIITNKFIVKAVNNYESLLEALKDALLLTGDKVVNVQLIKYKIIKAIQQAERGE